MHNAFKLCYVNAAGRTDCRWYHLAQADQAVADFNAKQAKGREAMLASYQGKEAGFEPQFCTSNWRA